jgi:O-antigen/teichoic acid export membrane protein
MGQLRRPIAFSALNSYIEGVLNFLLAGILSRLLTPDEIGVFLIAASVLALTETVRDFGAGQYLEQAREITGQGMRTTFTVLLIMSASLACIILLFAGEFAEFFHEPRLASAVRILCLPFFIRPFATPGAALLRRDMAFGSVAIVDITYSVTNFVTTILYVFLGCGYLSPAMGAVTGCAMSACVLFTLRPQFWMSRLTLVDWRKVISFGGYSSASGFLNVLSSQFPQLILGRGLSLGAVGLYNRAGMVLSLQEKAIFSAVAPTLLPTLAAEARGGGDLEKPFLYGMRLITAAQWPLLLCVAVMAEPVVHLFLGYKWESAVPIVRLTALASMFAFPSILTYPMLVSLGRIKDTLLLSATVTPIFAIALLAASNFGLIAVAASQFITIPVHMSLSVYLIRRQLPIKLSKILASVAPSAAVSLCAAAVPTLIVMTFGMRFDLPMAIIACAAFGAAGGWFFGLVVTKHPLLHELRQFLGLGLSSVPVTASRAPAE